MNKWKKILIFSKEIEYTKKNKIKNIKLKSTMIKNSKNSTNGLKIWKEGTEEIISEVEDKKT